MRGRNENKTSKEAKKISYTHIPTQINTCWLNTDHFESSTRSYDCKSSVGCHGAVVLLSTHSEYFY